jgi:hypothetical protein
MENQPFVIHKFGYLRSLQIVKNGLNNPKGMNIALNSPQQKIVLEGAESLFGFETDHPKMRVKIQRAISNKFAACCYVMLCRLISASRRKSLT